MSAVPGEQILLDGNVEAEGHEFFSLGSFEVSTDGDAACSTASTSPATSATPCACATSSPASSCPTRSPTPSPARPSRPTGASSSTRPSTTPGGPTPCGCTSSARPSTDDVKLFHEPDERYWVGAGFTRSDRYLVIGIGSSITCEEWLVDAADLRSEPRRGVAAHRGRRVRLRRTRSSTARTCCSSCTTTEPWTSSWCGWRHPTPPERGEVVVPHRPGERLLGVSDVPRLGRRRLPPRRAAAPRHARLRRRRRRRRSSSTSRCTPSARAATPSGRRRCSASATARSSRRAPSTTTTWRPASCCCASASPCSAATSPTTTPRRGCGRPRRTARRFRSRWSGSARSAMPAPRRAPCTCTATARTSTRSSPASRCRGCRSSTAASIFAVAHVRGGGEMGRQWYEDGKLLHKRNTFTDFVDCARHLIDNGLHDAPTAWSPRAARPAAC